MWDGTGQPMKLKPKRKKISGLGWSGLYYDGDLGWCLSSFVEHGKSASLTEDQERVLRARDDYGQWAPGDMYRVKITVSLVTDKKGRPIVKRQRRLLRS